MSANRAASAASAAVEMSANRAASAASAAVAASANPAKTVRRAVLAGLALAMLGSPSISAGCAASFDASSKVSALRVLAVTADKPYVKLEPANPDGTFPETRVKFTMTVTDGLVDDEGSPVTRPLQIVWLGGCFDPPGDQYYGCYEPLAKVLPSVLSGETPADGVVAAGIGLTEFELLIPRDIVTRRSPPPVGPYYGIGYIFFAVCAGNIKPVPPDGTGRAPDFPLGCFDADGNRLGPDSFVPGYTQVYSFADERENENPQMAGMKLGDKDLPEGTDLNLIGTVKACPLTIDERQTPNCSRELPEGCTPTAITPIIDPAVAEIDPDAKGADGQQLTEAIWVSYFSDRGDIAPGVSLVNDAVTGFNPDLGTEWLPPAEPGIATLWAVLRDARGGSSVIQRFVRVVP